MSRKSSFFFIVLLKKIDCRWLWLVYASVLRRHIVIYTYIASGQHSGTARHGRPETVHFCPQAPPTNFAWWPWTCTARVLTAFPPSCTRCRKPARASQTALWSGLTSRPRMPSVTRRSCCAGPWVPRPHVASTGPVGEEVYWRTCQCATVARCNRSVVLDIQRLEMFTYAVLTELKKNNKKKHPNCVLCNTNQPCLS